MHRARAIHRATLIVFLLAVVPVLGASRGSAQTVDALPAAPPLVISAGPPACDPIDPALAPLPSGGFVAAWSDGGVFLRRFDPHGAATGPLVSLRGGSGGPIQWRPAVSVGSEGHVAVVWVEPQAGLLRATVLDGALLTTGGPPFGFEAFELAVEIDFRTLPEVEAGPEGSFFAVWQEPDGLGFARFDREGLDLWRLLVSGSSDCRLREPSLAPDPLEGGTILAWIEECSDPPARQMVRARRLDISGRPSGSLIELSGEEPFAGLANPDLAVDDRGRLAVVWIRTSGAGSELRLDRRDPQGVSLPGGGQIDLGEVGDLATPKAVSDATGNLAVVWSRVVGTAERRQVFLRRLFADGTAAGDTVAVGPPSEPFERSADGPQIVLSGPGTGHVVWWEPLSFPPILPPACSSSAGVFGRRVSLGGERALLLHDGRFRVAVEWQIGPTGPSGRGHAIPGSEESGRFWFFDPANVELDTKVLDGREINGHFWFFSGALTNVGYRITVTDQIRDRTRRYDNPPGRLSSLADTQAFQALDELE